MEWIDNTIQTQYKEGLGYFNSMGFTQKWPEFERFKAGDQWPPPTEKTKNLPRPVFNIIDYIELHKIASVMNDNIKMLFTSQEIDDPENQAIDPKVQLAMEGADKFTNYAETTWENIQQDWLNEQMLESASNIGTGILHYYWDNTLKGGVVNQWVGNIAGEFIDSANTFFGNPQNNNVQKQPCILITSRELVSNVKEIAKNNKVPLEYIQQIKPDKEVQNELYDSAKKELDTDSKVTIVTKYYKKGGFIHFLKVVGNIIIQPETNTQLKLYPIVVMQWKPRKKSIYGVGDTEGLIPNQKGINFLLAMMMLSAQQTAWPKLLVKSEALQQVVTNEPGEILVDYNMNPGVDGIKYMQTGTFNPNTLTLVDKFIEVTKNFSGANDAAVGDAPGSNMAASAIMMLQKAAGVPIESIRKRYYRAMEDVGRIWEEFWKVKYNMPRVVKVKDDEGNEIMDSFTGTDYNETPFNLKIDIGAGGTYSESLSLATLDKLYDKGAIDGEEYLKYCPKNIAPFKDSLIKDIQLKNQQLAQQQAQQNLQAQQSEVDQMNNEIQQNNSKLQGGNVSNGQIGA